MKKAAIILLICVYSLATMGFSLKQFLLLRQAQISNFFIITGSKR